MTLERISVGEDLTVHLGGPLSKIHRKIQKIVDRLQAGAHLKSNVSRRNSLRFSLMGQGEGAEGRTTVTVLPEISTSKIKAF